MVITPSLETFSMASATIWPLLHFRKKRCNFCDLLFACYRLAHLCKDLNGFVGCFLHSFTKNDRVSACCQVFHSLVYHSLCQNRCGCGTVTCYIVGLCSNFFDELCAHVFKAVCQLDLFCNRNTIVCDERSAVLFVQNNVSSFRSKGYTYGICKLVYTILKSVSCLCSIFNLFCHDCHAS